MAQQLRQNLGLSNPQQHVSHADMLNRSTIPLAKPPETTSEIEAKSVLRRWIEALRTYDHRKVVGHVSQRKNNVTCHVCAMGLLGEIQGHAPASGQEQAYGLEAGIPANLVSEVVSNNDGRSGHRSLSFPEIATKVERWIAEGKIVEKK